MREAFKNKWNLKNIIVCYPTINNKINSKKEMRMLNNNQKKKFFFPSFPRGFKNFEVICEAYKLLNEDLKNKSEIILTIDKSIEDPYARHIVNKYHSIQGIKFIGLISREEVFQYYNNVDCLIFPSKLESWGLPITEFKSFNKPMFLADLPYAHETLGTYTKAYFFNPNQAAALSLLMKNLIEEKLKDTDHFKN